MPVAERKRIRGQCRGRRVLQEHLANAYLAQYHVRNRRCGRKHQSSPASTGSGAGVGTVARAAPGTGAASLLNGRLGKAGQPFGDSIGYCYGTHALGHRRDTNGTATGHQGDTKITFLPMLNIGAKRRTEKATRRTSTQSRSKSVGE